MRQSWKVIWLSATLAWVVPHGSGRPSGSGWDSGASYRTGAPGPYGYDPANSRLPPYAPQPGGYSTPSPPPSASPDEYGSEGAYDPRRRDNGQGRPGRAGGSRIGGRVTTGRAAARRRGGRSSFDDEWVSEDGDEGEEWVELEEPLEVDAVDLYCTRTLGRLAVTLASGVVGAGLGAALSASLLHKPVSCAVSGLVLGLVLSLFRNDFGALLRALGLMLILLLQRNREASGQYSALRQLGPALRIGARRPFPPAENPWAYTRSSETDIEFSMTKSLLAIAFVGCFSGWLTGQMINMFILPPWLLALAVGGLCSYTATLRDGKGDLMRVLGMKLVALVSLMRALDQELAVLGKLGKVCHISYATAAKVDAQFKVRERVWALASWVMSLANREADRVKHDMEGSGYGGPPPTASTYPPREEGARYRGPPPSDGYGRRQQQQQDEDPWARLPPFNPEAGRYGGGGGYARR